MTKTTFIRHYFEPSRLVCARQFRGLTRKELSGRMGVPVGELRGYEKQDYRASPPVKLARRIAFALGFPASFFYQDEMHLMKHRHISWVSGSQTLDAEMDEVLATRVGEPQLPGFEDCA